MVKFFKIIQNNWKKSIVGVIAVTYGIDYGINLYNIDTVMRAYCEDAVKFGDTPVYIDKHRRITVILNPAANKRKAKKHFEKYSAPLLYLSGMYVSILETEREGHAKLLVDKIDPNSDAIVIAGGDGTVSETLTGLMRSRGELCRIPIGVLPLGRTNTLANNLFTPKIDLPQEGSRIAEATMAVIKGHTKPVDAVRIEVLDNKNEEQKPVYGVAGIEWGVWRDVKKQQDKLWYFGPLRKYASLLFPGPAIDRTISAHVRYTPPCSGCSNCYSQRPDLSSNDIPSAIAPDRWWSRWSFQRRKMEQSKNGKPVIDYKTIVNESCGTIKEKEINTADICVVTTNVSNLSSEQTESPYLLLAVGPQSRYQGQFLSDGWKFIKGEEATKADKVKVKQIEIRPTSEITNSNSDSTTRPVESKEDSLAIDNEDYEVRPIRVTVLPNSVSVFCPS